MTLLLLGILVFIGIHLVPSAVPVRRALVGRMGAGGYKGAFSVVSAIGLLLLVAGKASADIVPVWNPPLWTRHLALSLMPFSLILLVAAYLPSNIKRVTAHPMLWGVTLWSVAHLGANGDLASMLLFGALGAFALFDMASANRRGATPSTTAYPVSRDAIVVLAGLALYGGLLLLHPYLFGVPVIVR